jgi:hypothetical protein
MMKPVREDLDIVLMHPEPFGGFDPEREAEILARLTAWLSEDKQNLGLLLNYAYERAFLAGLTVARYAIQHEERAPYKRILNQYIPALHSEPSQ